MELRVAVRCQPSVWRVATHSAPTTYGTRLPAAPPPSGYGARGRAVSPILAVTSRGVPSTSRRSRVRTTVPNANIACFVSVLCWIAH